MTAATLLAVLEPLANSSTPITLDTSVHSIIPDDFILSDDHATLHATLKDVLSHRLGYPRHEMSYGGKGFTVKDAARLLRDLQMTKELRTEFQYCNFGYMVIHEVINALTGRWIGDVMEESLFRPLGMENTFVNLSQALKIGDKLASGYAWDDLAQQMNHQPWWETLLIGPGGVISSANDFTKYLQALVNGTLPLSAKSQRLLFEPLMIEGGPVLDHMSPSLYAMGWSVAWYRGHKFISHNGGLPGFTSLTGFLPDLGWGAVVLTNGDVPGSAASSTLFYRLLDDFLDVPLEDRLDTSGRWDNILRELQGKYKGRRGALFPDIPSPPISLTRPLEDYQGTYFHPAYKNITLRVASPSKHLPVAEETDVVLRAVWEKEWPVVIELEHVSGEHFVAWINLVVPGPIVREGGPAVFEVGPNGDVSKLGIEMEPALGQMIWFSRQD